MLKVLLALSVQVKHPNLFPLSTASHNFYSVLNVPQDKWFTVSIASCFGINEGNSETHVCL